MIERLPSGTLKGGMQSWPLTLDRVLSHAARWHGHREVVSFCDDGTTRRQSYAEIARDAARLSNALKACSIGKGDRVATLAMNGGGHLTAWYAIMGIGAVCHTLNPRIGEDHLAWMVNQASDRILIVDGAFGGLARRLMLQGTSIEKVIYLTAPQGPDPAEGRLLDEILAEADDTCIWGDFEEESAAGLCYTSGTSGKPKGVLYSHRSSVLHSLMTSQADMFDLSARDVVMPLVPMYHANAWGLAFSAPAVGARLIMPGSQLDGATLYRRMSDEGVTFAAAVPTAWLGLIEHMEATGNRLPRLTKPLVGGAPLSEAFLQRFEAMGLNVTHAWGMTELSPIGGVASLLPETLAMDGAERVAYRIKQGRAFFGIDMKIVDAECRPMPQDGKCSGNLQMRGPTVAARYFGMDSTMTTPDGYMETGDVARIDPLGYMQITDRAKDVIKSGGEWISSIELELAASSFPGVALVAAIAVPHPKYDERPLLLVKPEKGAEISPTALLNHMAQKVPKWWLPDRIKIVEDIPVGATGKIDKAALARAHR